jgi:hypothetical protein
MLPYVATKNLCKDIALPLIDGWSTLSNKPKLVAVRKPLALVPAHTSRNKKILRSSVVVKIFSKPPRPHFSNVVKLTDEQEPDESPNFPSLTRRFSKHVFNPPGSFSATALKSLRVETNRFEVNFLND